MYYILYMYVYIYMYTYVCIYIYVYIYIYYMLIHTTYSIWYQFVADFGHSKVLSNLLFWSSSPEAFIPRPRASSGNVASVAATWST